MASEDCHFRNLSHWEGLAVRGTPDNTLRVMMCGAGIQSNPPIECYTLVCHVLYALYRTQV